MLHLGGIITLVIVVILWAIVESIDQNRKREKQKELIYTMNRLTKVQQGLPPGPEKRPLTEGEVLTRVFTAIGIIGAFIYLLQVH